MNGIRRGVFATLEGINSLEDPQIEVPVEPEWREVDRKGIDEIGRSMRMMDAN